MNVLKYNLKKFFLRHTHHLYHFNFSHKVMHDRCCNVVMCHHFPLNIRINFLVHLLKCYIVRFKNSTNVKRYDNDNSVLLKCIENCSSSFMSHHHLHEKELQEAHTKNIYNTQISIPLFTRIRRKKQYNNSGVRQGKLKCHPDLIFRLFFICKGT